MCTIRLQTAWCGQLITKILRDASGQMNSNEGPCPLRRPTTGSPPELLHVLMLPEFERAHGIGEFWGNPITRTFAELLIDCEEDKTMRAVVFGLLREMERK